MLVMPSLVVSAVMCNVVWKRSMYKLKHKYIKEKEEEAIAIWKLGPFYIIDMFYFLRIMFK